MSSFTRTMERSIKKKHHIENGGKRLSIGKPAASRKAISRSRASGAGQYDTLLKRQRAASLPARKSSHVMQNHVSRSRIYGR